MLRHFTLILFTLATIVCFAGNGLAQRTAEEGHVLVSLRVIGHQLLLQAGDSSSRILPVEKEGARYKLQFTSDLHFDPEQLVSLVDSVVQKAQIAESYLVEVESCQMRQVVYSYEIGDLEKLDLVPCQGRIQPKGCYLLFFTILEAHHPVAEQGKVSLAPAESDLSIKIGMDYSELLMGTLAAIILIGISVYFIKKSVPAGGNTNLIPLGAYQFDTRNMELRHTNEVVELSSKESDLLLLLHSSANSTLEREFILKAVWGDEGDYVGRTLDVFISRLRKKLEADSSIKIVNVRGVGYKLILNE